MIFDHIKKLQSYGFKIFPLAAGGKLPAVNDFTHKATNDFEAAKIMWEDPILETVQDFNIGVATTELEDGTHLLVVDVDNKGKKKGSEEILKLELEGKEFPPTFTQKTPTGGYHYVYKTKESFKQGANVIGPGIDTRSRGGFILGAGSRVGTKNYSIEKEIGIAIAPQWLVDFCKSQEKASNEKKDSPKKEVNQKEAIKRAREFLKKAAVAVEGAGGDETTYKVCSRLKDFGIDQQSAFVVLQEWNERCQPPWDIDDLERKLENAWSYSQNAIGADTPEAVFDPIDEDDADEMDDPLEELNKRFAFIILGGKSTIIRKLESGGVDYIGVQAFKDLLKSRVMFMGDGKKRQLADLWMASNYRKEYEQIDLLPGIDAPPNVYNLWRGFNYEPLSPTEKPTPGMLEAWRMFQDHALHNVCLGDEKLFQWLMNYFAHLIQKPWEKPLTALVFHGLKGVGKSFLVDSIGKLFGDHYQVASHPRYLIGNFNNHFTKTVLFSLEEAAWAGDKQAEGVLKDLITGGSINIEQKGREPFSIRNVLRIVMISNEDWVIPATSDERRFAVFSVGNNRRGDLDYFRKMIALFKNGGYRYLLTQLMNYKIEIDINRAPTTAGLLDQKIESLNAVHSWWFSCLKESQLLSVEFQDSWPETIDKNMMRMGCISFSKERGVRSWMPSAEKFSREMKKVCQSFTTSRIRQGADRIRVFAIPPLEQARKEFQAFIGHEIDWGDEEIDPFS